METSRAEAGAPKAKCCSWLLLAVLVLVGGALRVAACFSEFWLDEIWTFFRVQELGSIGDIFTKFTGSNNHHLNTFFFFVLGEQNNWFIYRIPSLVAGILTIPLAWIIASRAGKVAAVIGGALTAGSYLLVHFSSEARGYSPAVFFALATLLILRRFTDGGGWRWVVLFWFFVCLGVLSHLSYLFVFVACAAWLPFELRTGPRKKLAKATDYAACIGVPALILGFFYLAVIRHMEISPATSDPIPVVLVTALSYAVGGPGDGPLAIMASVVAVGIVLWGINVLRRQARTEWIFFLIVIFMTPTAAILWKRPEVLFVRYFMVSIVFGYIVIAMALGTVWKEGGQGRLWAGVALFLFLAGNTANVERLLSCGRGGHLRALRYIEAHTPTDVVTITSDHPFRNAMIIEYYKRYLTEGKTIVYVPRHNGIPPAPQWMVVHRVGKPTDIAPGLKDRFGNTYQLVKTFPYSAISGSHWFLYRKSSSPQPGPRL